MSTLCAEHFVVVIEHSNGYMPQLASRDAGCTAGWLHASTCMVSYLTTHASCVLQHRTLEIVDTVLGGMSGLLCF